MDCALAIVSGVYGAIAIIIFYLVYVIEVKLDNSTPGNENELQNVSHARLRRLIESIIAETARQPRSASPENSGFNQQLNSLSYNGNHCNGNAGQYFEPKKYQDLLATAVLNKIVDTHGNGRYSESSPDLTSSAFDKNHNSLFPSKTDESISSSSSIEPRSESSLTDPLNNINKGDDVLSPTGSYGNFYADVANENIDADRESVLSDFIASHMVPLPTISAEPASEEDIEDEDFISVTSSGRDPTWEDNWLFKKKRCSKTASSVGMLVPAPKEDIRALIGDKTTDEISDLSEVGSDTDESSQEMVSANTEPLNGRLLNQHLIGGKNTKVVLDELVEQSSLISTSSLPENAPPYTETKNDFVISNDGLSEVEQSKISLSNCNTAISNEAVNCNVTKSIPNESTEKSEVSAKEAPNTEEHSVVVPPNDCTDDEKMRNLMAKFNEEQEGKQVDSEETFSISPRSSTSGPLSAEISRAELDQHEGITSFCGDQSNEIDASLRRPSVIEILAAIALGPMLAVSASDDKNILTEMEVSSLMELNQLAMAELNAKNAEGQTNTLGVIPEEPPDHEELQITRIEAPDVLTSPKIVMDVVKDLEEFQGTNVATGNSSSTEMTTDTTGKINVTRKSGSQSQENSPKAINHSINCGFDILAPPISFSDGTSALSEAHIAPNVEFFSNKVLISQDLVETQTTPGNLSVGISGIEEKVYREKSENIYMKDNSEMHIVAYDQKQKSEDKSLFKNESLFKEIEGTTSSPIVTTIKSATDAEIISNNPIEEQNVEEKHPMVNKELSAGQTVEAQNPEMDLPVNKASVNTEIAQETNINKPDSKEAALTIQAVSDFNKRIEESKSPTENIILAQDAISQSTNEQHPEAFITAAVAQKPFTEQPAEESKHKEIPLVKGEQESINKILRAETIKEVLEPASSLPHEEIPPITVPPNTEVTTDITIEQFAKSLHIEASAFTNKPAAHRVAIPDAVHKQTDQVLNEEKIVLVSVKSRDCNSNIETITVQPAEIQKDEETTPAIKAVPPCTEVVKDLAVEQRVESSNPQETGPAISTSETTDTVTKPDVEKATETSKAERAVPEKKAPTADASQEPTAEPKENEITPEAKVSEAKQSATEHMVEQAAASAKSETSASALSTSNTTDTVLKPEAEHSTKMSSSQDTTPEIGALKVYDASQKQAVKLPAEAKEEEITLKLKSPLATEAAKEHAVEKSAESPNAEETSIAKSATESPSTVDTELVIESPKINDAGQSSANEQLAPPKEGETTTEAKASAARQATAEPVVEQPIESPKSKETTSELSASATKDTVPKPEAEEAIESSNTENMTEINNANQNRAAGATAPACTQTATNPVVEQSVKFAETVPSISASNNTETIQTTEAEKTTETSNSEDIAQPPKAAEKGIIPEVKSSVALSEHPDGSPNGQETAAAFAAPEISQADSDVQKATKTSNSDSTAADIIAFVPAVTENNNTSPEATAEQPAEGIYGDEIIPEVRASETTKMAKEPAVDNATSVAISAPETTRTAVEQSSETSNSEEIAPENKALQTSDASQTPTVKQHTPEVSASAAKHTATESLAEPPAASVASENTATAISAPDTTDTAEEAEHRTGNTNTDNTTSETTTPIIATPVTNVPASQAPNGEQPVERIQVEGEAIIPEAISPAAKQTATELVVEHSPTAPASEDAPLAISASDTTDTVPKSEAEQAGETSNYKHTTPEIEALKTNNASRTPADKHLAVAPNEEEITHDATSSAPQPAAESVVEQPPASPAAEETAPSITAPDITDTALKSEAEHATETLNTDNPTSDITAPVIATPESNNQSQDTTAEQPLERTEGIEITPDSTAPAANITAAEQVVEQSPTAPLSEEAPPAISAPDTTHTAPKSEAEQAAETSNNEDTTLEIEAPKTKDVSQTPAAKQPAEAPNEEETTHDAASSDPQPAAESVVEQPPASPASEESAHAITPPDITDTAPKSEAEHATETSNTDNTTSEITAPVIVTPETNNESQDTTVEQPLERTEGVEITPDATAPTAQQTATEFKEMPTAISVADTTVSKSGSEHATETSNAEDTAAEINVTSQTPTVKQPDETPKEEETIPEATQTATECQVEQPAEHATETSNAKDTALEIETPKTNDSSQTPTVNQPDKTPKEEETIPEAKQLATQTATESVVEQPAASPVFGETALAISALESTNPAPKSETEQVTETPNTDNSTSEITAPGIPTPESNNQSQDTTAEQPVERIEGVEIRSDATTLAAKQTATELVADQSPTAPVSEEAAPAISALDTTHTAPKSEAGQAAEASNNEDTALEIEAPKTKDVSQTLAAKQPAEAPNEEETTHDTTPGATQSATESVVEKPPASPALEDAAPVISAPDTADTVPKPEAMTNNGGKAFQFETPKTGYASQTQAAKQPTLDGSAPVATQTESTIEQLAASPADEKTPTSISAQDSTNTAPKSEAEHKTETSNSNSTTSEITPAVIAATETKNTSQYLNAEHPTARIEGEEITPDLSVPAHKQTATESGVEKSAASPASEEMLPTISAQDTTDTASDLGAEIATETPNAVDTAPEIEAPKINDTNQTPTVKQTDETSKQEETIPEATPAGTQSAAESVVEQPAESPAFEKTPTAISAQDSTNTASKSEAEHAIETPNTDNTLYEIAAPVIATSETSNQSQDTTAEHPVERIEGVEITPDAITLAAKQTATEVVAEQSLTAPVTEEAASAISAPETTDTISKSEAEQADETLNHADTALEIEVEKTNDASQTPTVKQPDEAPKEEETTPEATQSATESQVEQPAEHATETSNAKDTALKIETPNTNDSSQTPTVNQPDEAPKEEETTPEATPAATQSAAESVVKDLAASAAFEETGPAISALESTNTAPKSETEHDSETSNNNSTTSEIKAAVIATPETNNQSSDTTPEQPAERIEGVKITLDVTASAAKQTATEVVVGQSPTAPVSEEAAPAISAPDTTDTVPKSETEQADEASNNVDTALEIEVEEIKDASQTPTVKQPDEAPKEKETTTEAIPTATQSATESVVELPAASAAYEETAPAISALDTTNTAPKSEIEHATETSNNNSTTSEIKAAVVAATGTKNTSQYLNAEHPTARIEEEEITPECTAPADKQTATESVVKQPAASPASQDTVPTISTQGTTDTTPESGAENATETLNVVETAPEIEAPKINDSIQTPTAKQPDETPKKEETTPEGTPAAMQSAAESVVKELAASAAFEETTPAILALDSTNTAPQSEAEHETETSNNSTIFEITAPVIVATETKNASQYKNADHPTAGIEGEEITPEASASVHKQTATESEVEKSASSPAFEEMLPTISAQDTKDTAPDLGAEIATETPSAVDTAPEIEAPKMNDTNQTLTVKQPDETSKEEETILGAKQLATQTATESVVEQPAESPAFEKTPTAISIQDSTNTAPKSEAEYATQTPNTDNTSSEITAPVIATPETNNQSQDTTAEQPVEGVEITPDATTLAAKQTATELVAEQSPIAPVTEEAASAISAPETTDTVSKSEAEQADEASNHADTALEIEVEKTNDASQTPTVKQPDEAPKEEETTPEATETATESQDEQPAEHATETSNAKDMALEIETPKTNDSSQTPTVKQPDETPKEEETTPEATPAATQSAAESVVKDLAASAAFEETAPAILSLDTTNTAPQSEAEHETETSNNNSTIFEITPPVIVATETKNASQYQNAEHSIAGIEGEEITPEPSVPPHKQTATESGVEKSAASPASEEMLPTISAQDTTDTASDLGAEIATETPNAVDTAPEIEAPKINDTNQTPTVKQTDETSKEEETILGAKQLATQTATESVVEQPAESPAFEKTPTAISAQDSTNTASKSEAEYATETPNTDNMSSEISAPVIATPETNNQNQDTTAEQPVERIEGVEITSDATTLAAKQTAIELVAEQSPTAPVSEEAAPAISAPYTTHTVPKSEAEQADESSNHTDTALEIEVEKANDASQTPTVKQPDEAPKEEETTPEAIPAATQSATESVVEQPAVSAAYEQTVPVISALDSTNTAPKSEAEYATETPDNNNTTSEITTPVIASTVIENTSQYPNAEHPAARIEGEELTPERTAPADKHTATESVVEQPAASPASEDTVPTISTQGTTDTAPESGAENATETSNVLDVETLKINDASQTPSVKPPAEAPNEKETTPEATPAATQSATESVVEQPAASAASKERAPAISAPDTTSTAPESEAEHATETSNIDNIKSEITTPLIVPPETSGQSQDPTAEQPIERIEGEEITPEATATAAKQTATEAEIEQSTVAPAGEEAAPASSAPDTTDTDPKEEAELASNTSNIQNKLLEIEAPKINDTNEIPAVIKPAEAPKVNEITPEATASTATQKATEPLVEHPAASPKPQETSSAVSTAETIETVTKLVAERSSKTSNMEEVAPELDTQKPIEASPDEEIEKEKIMSVVKTLAGIEAATEQCFEQPKPGEGAITAPVTLEAVVERPAEAINEEQISPEVKAPPAIGASTVIAYSAESTNAQEMAPASQPPETKESGPDPGVDQVNEKSNAEGAVVEVKAPTTADASQEQGSEQPAGEEEISPECKIPAATNTAKESVVEHPAESPKSEETPVSNLAPETTETLKSNVTSPETKNTGLEATAEQPIDAEEIIQIHKPPATTEATKKSMNKQPNESPNAGKMPLEISSPEITEIKTPETADACREPAVKQPEPAVKAPAPAEESTLPIFEQLSKSTTSEAAVLVDTARGTTDPVPEPVNEQATGLSNTEQLVLAIEAPAANEVSIAEASRVQVQEPMSAIAAPEISEAVPRQSDEQTNEAAKTEPIEERTPVVDTSGSTDVIPKLVADQAINSSKTENTAFTSENYLDADEYLKLVTEQTAEPPIGKEFFSAVEATVPTEMVTEVVNELLKTEKVASGIAIPIQTTSGVVLEPIAKSSDKTPKTEKTAVIETKETFNEVLEPTDIQPDELPKNEKSAHVIEAGIITEATKFAAEETSPDILAQSVVASTTEPLLSNRLVPETLANKSAKSTRAEGAGLVNEAPETSEACLYEDVEHPAESTKPEETAAPIEEQETCAKQPLVSTKDEETKPLTGAVGDRDKDSILIFERPSEESNDIHVESVHRIEKAAATGATTGFTVEQPAETQTDDKTTRATAKVAPGPVPEKASEILKAANVTLAIETPPTADKELKLVAGKEAEVPDNGETAPATDASKSSNALEESIAQQSTIAPKDNYSENVIDATSTPDGSSEIIPEQAADAKQLLTTPTDVAALITEKASEALKDDGKETEIETLSAVGTLTGLVVELPAETPKAPKTSQVVPSQINEQLSENTSTGSEETALAIAEQSSEIPVIGVTSAITQEAITIESSFEAITAKSTGVDKEHLLVVENTSAGASPAPTVNVDSGTEDRPRPILDTNNISEVGTFSNNTFAMTEDKASGVKIETINDFTSQVSEAITEIVTEPQEIPPISSISTTCKPIKHSPLQSTESLSDTAQNPKEVYDEISHPALEVSRNKSVPCLADELKMAAAKNDVKQLPPKRVRPQSIESIIRYFTAELHTPKPHAQNSLKGNHNHNNQLTPNAMQNSFSRQSQSQSQSQSFTTPLTTITSEPTEPKYRGSRFRKLTIEDRRFLAELEKRRRQRELIQNYLDTLATIETPSYLTEDLYLESNCFVESTPFSLFSEPPDSIVGATSSSSSARKYFLNNILFSDRISSDSNNTDESTTTVIDTYSYSASLRGSSTDSDSGGEFSRDESTNRESTTDTATATATTITTNTLSTNNVTNQSHINSQLLPLPELKTESACSKLQVVETRTSGGNEEHVDDDPLKHLVPGSIAEREYKKWYNAVDMPNNPYSAEALRRRLSGGHERVIDLPNISPCVEEKPIVLSEDENKVIDDKSQQRDYTRYSRDYYINDAKHASGATKKRFTPATTPSLTDSPSIKTPSTSSPSSIEIEDHSEGTMVSQYPVRSMCNKLEKQSNIEKEPDVYTARPARVEEIMPEQVFTEIELQIASTISPLTTEAVGKLSSDSNSVPTTDSLTPSEDSDTVRIYDLKKQETRIVKDYQPSVPNTPKKARPTDLDITPVISEPNTIVSAPSKITTPTPFKFLQPKRKLIDPSQVLSIDLDIEPVSPTSTDKTVIEQEVVQSLPSVRALAKAFLLTSSSCPASDKWRKARARSPAAAAPAAAPTKTTTATPVATLTPTPATAPAVAVDQKLSEPQIIADTTSQESEDATIASDLSSLETDPPSKREANTSDSLALSQEPSQDRTLSPVLVPGCLKNNIAFFENLKNK